jgi:hypothetical protein
LFVGGHERSTKDARACQEGCDDEFVRLLNKRFNVSHFETEPANSKASSDISCRNVQNRGMDFRSLGERKKKSAPYHGDEKASSSNLKVLSRQRLVNLCEFDRPRMTS